jgi:branched-chain amino acid transport system permease protein
MAQSETARASKFSAFFDQRTRVSVFSAVSLFLLVCGVLALIAGLGFASERLLKIAAINIIAGVGLGLFCGSTGILSLGHVVFFGIGAYVSAWFTIPSTIKPILLPQLPAPLLNVEWPLVAAIVPATCAAAIVGVLAGFVMQRLRETSAVIASFGFLVIAYLLFIGLKPLTNGKQSLYALPTEQVTWPLVLGLLALALIVAFAVKSSRIGRAAESFRENEPAARSIGIRSERPIFGVWVVSAAIMGAAGALFAHSVGVVSPSSFYLDKTFALIVLVIVGGYRSLTGAVVGAIFVSFAEEIFKKTEEFLNGYSGTELAFGFVMPNVFGLTALSFSLLILLVLYYRPEGVAGYKEIAAHQWFQRLFPNVFAKKTAHSNKPNYHVDETAVLTTTNLQKSYGAFCAMDKINLEVKAGQIVGLIGPNGAGKSTFINVITGNLFATGGSIQLNGNDVTLASASELAKIGLGRTFQNIRTFGAMSALENVIAAVNVSRPDMSRLEAEQLALNWLAFLGLENKYQEQADGLAYGDQRRLEIARALALEPQFLILDEPAAGMNDQETKDLTDLLQQIVQRIGCGILLVEHDLPMVMALCDQIYVVNKGEQIASGTPQEVQADPHVIEAYIGEEMDD